MKTKIIYSFLFIFFGIFSNAQNLNKIAKEITAEGIALYRSEMASWYGTDVFVENYKDREKIWGYFSYTKNDEVPTCVFFSKENKVIGTISFPTDYNPKNSKLDLTERDFSDVEKDYFTIRQATYQKIKNDTIFNFYKNVNFNIVPLINKDGEKRVYVFSGTNQNNTVLFGNDYLLNFDKNNELKKIQRLHNSLLTFSIYDEKIGKTVGGVHSHVLEDWPYITPTDICTLMLYQKFTNWENYTVISKKYTSLWNGKSNFLVIMKTEDFKKINEGTKNKNPEN
jgi:hypothetical protein